MLPFIKLYFSLSPIYKSTNTIKSPLGKKVLNVLLSGQGLVIAFIDCILLF